MGELPVEIDGYPIPKPKLNPKPTPGPKIKAKTQYKRIHHSPATPINKGIKLIKPMNNNK